MQYKVFGCKVNKYYTDKWLNSEYLRDKTGTFVASCVVTDSAKRKWVRFVKKEVETLSGKSKVYISGCGAFKDGKAQTDFFEIYPDLAFAREMIEVLDEEPETPPLSGILSLTTTSSQPSPLGEKERAIFDEKMQPLSPPKEKGFRIEGALSKLKQAQKTQIYTRKYLLIQGGCDSFCTFCLTVQKRGRHYFRAKEDIVEEILEFESEGGKEVVLTGVNLSAWGLDNTHDIQNFSEDLIKNGFSGGGSRFAELLEYILGNTSIARVRISSLGPEFIDEACLKIFEDTRIYPHFHFSIQSGSSNILKSMARHYDGDYMKRLLQKTLAVPRSDGVAISIGADLIVGFPGETEADFMDTYNLVQDCQITKVHAFPFSAHTMGESVPAGKFKSQVSEAIKKDRMNRLMQLGDQVREDFKASQKGKIFKVLVEKSDLSQSPHNTSILNSFPSKGKEARMNWSGWTENYLEADQSNFEIISGVPKRNSIIVGKFK
ncbi:radical SAM protein [Candidatus Gracilibacteria bacterium]|nr:radical SAM protein [Candidatus Gracilibacteria bacterium]